MLPFGFFAVDAIFMEFTIWFGERFARKTAEFAARVFLWYNTQDANNEKTTTVTIKVL